MLKGLVDHLNPRGRENHVSVFNGSDLAVLHPPRMNLAIAQVSLARYTRYQCRGSPSNSPRLVPQTAVKSAIGSMGSASGNSIPKTTEVCAVKKLELSGCVDVGCIVVLDVRFLRASILIAHFATSVFDPYPSRIIK